MIYPRYYELWICPVCRLQAEPDPDGDRGCHHAEYGGYVEPIRLTVEPPRNLNAAILSEETQAYLKELHRKHLTSKAMWEWWESLPQEERDRRERERRAAMSAWELAWEDSILSMNRPAWRSFPEGTWSGVILEEGPSTKGEPTKGGYTVVPIDGAADAP